MSAKAKGTLGVDSQNLKQGAEGEVGNAKPHGDETFAAAGPKIWYLDPENRYYGNMGGKKQTTAKKAIIRQILGQPDSGFQLWSCVNCVLTKNYCRQKSS